MLTIKEITDKKDIKAFMHFPSKLYKDNPYFVPDFTDSQVADFDREKNPAYEYCDTKCFLAYRDGAIVGRIAAIYNKKANAKFNMNQMRFWHLDFIDDEEVSAALLNAVETWAHELQCTSVHGPLGFSDMDREGLLIEGFDRLSMFITYYNYPYYKVHLERLGYKKEADWVEFRISIPAPDDERIIRLTHLSEKIGERMGLNIAPLKSKRAIRPYVEKVFALYNEVYTLFGMIPLTPRQVTRYVDEFLPLIDERTTAILENDKGDVVAFGVAAPSISRAMQKAKGRLFPLGWFHVLRALKGKNNTLDLFLIAVHPDYQGKGIPILILGHLLRFAYENGIRYAETGPELETNANVQSQWRYFDTEQHKRRRCFIKPIGEE